MHSISAITVELHILSRLLFYGLCLLCSFFRFCCQELTCCIYGCGPLQASLFTFLRLSFGLLEQSRDQHSLRCMCYWRFTMDCAFICATRSPRSFENSFLM